MGTTPDGASDGFTEEPIYATPPAAAAPAAAPAAPPPAITVGTGLNGEVTQSDVEAAQRDAAARAESSNPTGPAGSAGDRLPGDATGSASANNRPTNVSQGTVTQTTGGQRDDRATSNPSASSQATAYTLSSVQPNPLAGFSSYNALWTMACLKPDQFNQPQSYRDNDSALENVIISSGGYLDSKRVKTAYGSPEYFIQNFEMTSIIVPQGGSTGNTINFKFQVYEPHSLGLFMQSCQAAAVNSGYLNYLLAPYILKLDFVGWDANGREKRIPGATRYFPIKLVLAKFTVTEGGSLYDVTAIPYNHSGFSNVVDVTMKDLKISGGTVKELLTEGETSLSVALTKSSEILQKNGLIGSKDTFVVTFPTDDSGNTRSDNAGSATVNPAASGGTTVGSGSGSGGSSDNPIGQSSMGFDMNSGGTTEPGREVDAYNKDGMIDKTKVTIDPKSRTFTFAQGQKITDIITQVVLASEYAKKAVTSKPAADGTVDWFKVDVQIKLVEFDPTRNDYSKIFVFRVIPFKAHSSVFKKAAAASPGTDQIKKKITKRYDYIYTGKNEDVLKFDLNFNTSFFTAISPARPEAGSQRDPAQNKASNDAVTKVAAPPGGNVAALAQAGGAKRVLPNIQGEVYAPGGAAADDVATAVARDFHSNFLQQKSDLINLDLDILGDPYYILNSGIGNYFSAPSGSINADGSMAYEGSEVFIYIAFRNPIDIQVNGPLYKFPDGGSLSPFSGIYRVTKVVSNFRDGTFVQKVSGYRLVGQPEEGDPNGRLTVNQAADKVAPLEAVGKVDAASENNPSNPDAPQ